MKATVKLEKGMRLIGMNEKGFRHLIAYCKTVFGRNYDIFTNTKTQFYQSQMLYRYPPIYVWHVIELITIQDVIVSEIAEQKRRIPHFFQRQNR